MAPGWRELERRNESHTAAVGDALQSLVVDGRIMIADEQQIQPRRQLRAGQIAGRRDRFGLVGVMVQIRRVPAAGRWIEPGR